MAEALPGLDNVGSRCLVHALGQSPAGRTALMARLNRLPPRLDMRDAALGEWLEPEVELEVLDGRDSPASYAPSRKGSPASHLRFLREFVAVPPPADIQAAHPSGALALAPGQVEILRRGLASPSAIVRCETVRILGHGQSALTREEWTRLAFDPDFPVAAAAVEWAGLLIRDDEGRDPVVREWAEFCAAHLGADALALTR